MFQLESQDEADFAAQMKSLAAEAQQQIEERSGRRAPPSLLQMLHPIVMGIEALTRATAENTGAVAKLEAAAAAQPKLPEILNAMNETIERESPVTQKLFDALY